MTVEELIDILEGMPKTAMVFIESMNDDEDWIDDSIEDVLYLHGRVRIRFMHADAPKSSGDNA